MKSILFFAAMLFTSVAAWAQSSAAKPVILKSPADFQILDISPNGKWACGCFNDYSYVNYGFRWNLESDEVEMLSTTATSEAFAITNDGVVVGMYTDNTYNANGADFQMPGYYKDGSWHALELPAGTLESGMAYAVTPDGQYIAGVVVTNGIFAGYVWKDGKLYRTLDNTRHAIPYGISPDGQSATGWVQQYNRTACYWDAEGNTNMLSDYQSPWSSGRSFSPDGTKILYWGGWDDGEVPQLYAVYDIATKTSSKLPTIRPEAGLDVLDISNKGTVVGFEDQMGYIYQDGKAQYIDEYLAAKGIDLSTLGVLLGTGEEEVADDARYQLFRVQCISPDDDILGIIYYDDSKDEEGNYAVSMRSMIIKFNENATNLSPVAVKAQQLSGIMSALVTWKKNVAADGVTGYNLYRNGVKVNDAPLTEPSYADTNLESGQYTYTVTALYGDVESDKSEQVSVTVAPQAISSPVALYARQRGYNSAVAQWMRPDSNFPTKTYYDANTDNLQGFGVNVEGFEYENAIRFSKAEMSAYKNLKIRSVGFCPMSEQASWKINLYTYSEDGALVKFYSQNVTQELNYGQKNTVVLDTPQNVPDGELVVAVEVSVSSASQNITGMCYGKSVDEYSDLLRLTYEPDFYSLNSMSLAGGYLYPASWNIDVNLAAEGADASIDNVDHYNVFVDGKQAATATETSCLIKSVADGSHTLAVSAVYANGKESPQRQTTLDIAANSSVLPAVENVGVAVEGSSAIKATWQQPTDKDANTVTYAGKIPSSKGVVGPESNNYGLMAGAIYTPSMLKGYDGYRVKAVRFYPMGDAMFTVYIYKDNEQLCEIPVDDYTIAKWNVVPLDQEITISDKSNYRLVIDCYDVTPNANAIAVDINSPVTYYSDLYSIDGESWESISTAAVYGNWMMGLDIEDAEGVALDVAGYDVRIDGAKKNSDMITATEFSYDFGAEDAVQHTINVDVYYNVSPTSVSGTTNRFFIGAAGIDDNTIARLEVRQGDNEVTVAGDNVTSVDIVAANGATVASATGNTVAINGLSAGIYVVKAVVDGKTVARKIQIVK